MADLLDRSAALLALLEQDRLDVWTPVLGESVLACASELIDAGNPSLASTLLSRATERLADVVPDWSVRGSVVQVRALVAAGKLLDATRLAQTVSLQAAESLERLQADRWQLRITEAYAMWLLNRSADAIERLSDIRRELLLQPDSAILSRCALNLSSAHILAGNNENARRFALEALVSAWRSGERNIEASAHGNLSLLDRFVCRWASSEDSARRAEAIFGEFGYRAMANHARRTAAIVAWKRGRLDEALKSAALCIEESIAIADEPARWMDTLLSAMVLLHRGDYAAARAALTSDADWLVPVAHSRQSLLTVECLGDLSLEQGDIAAALQSYERARIKATALVPKGDIVAELRRRQAECYYLMGRFGEAHEEALAGLDHCRELGDRYEEAATYRVLALSTAAVGRPADAKRWFDQGFAYYDDIETPYEWGKLWMAYGDWLHGPHAGEYRDEKAALEAYAAAADHFERMGAQAKLAEANARIVALKPVPPKSASPAVAAALASRSARPARKPRAQVELERRAAWAMEMFGFVTRDRGVLDLLDEVAKLAVSDAPILVLGESGTGKELVANGVHRLSGRSGQFVAINCGAIPRDMIESELFGHVAGAFTGATRDKPGIFETCDGGTVFLDEVGEMSLDLQSRLLRFLERSEARRVGSNRNYSVDTRVVGATNRERLALERGEGFRPDLYYRLAHAVIVLPPLRRRGDDIQILIDHFLAEFGRAQGRPIELADSARERLSRHTWPGNVRQLRAVIRRASLLSVPGVPVEASRLQLDEFSAPVTLVEEMEAAEKARIVETLARSRGSRTEAARSLGMPRTTLINKMQRHGLM